MNLYGIVGFAYEASLHCVNCTLERFPTAEGEDSEGNQITALFGWNSDHYTMNGDTVVYEHCSDCGDELC